MINRGALLRQDWVKANKSKCEKCGKPAYSEHYDIDWDTHKFCEECSPDNKGEYSSHWCPNVDDNYGPQVVKVGENCPFCGVNPEGGKENETFQS